MGKFKLKFHSLFDVGNEIVDLDSFLLHGISVADGHAAVVFGIKVVGDAERSTDLVLTAVTLTDRTCLVEVNGEVLGEHLANLHSLS